MSTLWDRLSTGVMHALDRPPGPAAPAAPGPGARAPVVPLAERLGLRNLSDEALRNELERRRRARGRPAHGRPAADDELTALAQARRDRMRERTLGRCYAMLELGPGAKLGEIQRAYRTQLRQFHPDRHLGDPESHASAVALATQLTEAYLSLLGQFDRR